MTMYALAPTSKWTATSPATPSAMLAEGLLNAYRVRSNGTMRHLELYPLGSTTREAAEWVSDRIDMDGASVQAVARELHVSTPTIRRYLEALELTEDIEAGDWDDLRFDSTGTPIFDVYSTEESGDVDAIEDLLNNAPQVADLIEANSKGTDVAPRPTRTRTRKPVSAEDQAAKDAELLVRNQARFAPKTEAVPCNCAKRISSGTCEHMADVPGSQCEPAGTTADELETALAASVAQAAPRTDALPMCFCGDQGVHAPGAQGCKHTAIPRRTRSH